jgi:DNA-binding NtrC family response regulator
VDFRVIAATNKDLAALVRTGAFREDLYWRLNVFAIEIPPLRDRPEDVLPLALHFLERFALAMGRKALSLSSATKDALTAYGWPGNVRELQNAVERAVVVAKGTTIEPADLPLHVTGAPVRSAPGSLAAVERAHVLAVLESTGWNITHAARILEVDRVTLYNKIRRYGLQRSGHAVDA